jgi:hypothetical protein
MYEVYLKNLQRQWELQYTRWRKKRKWNFLLTVTATAKHKLKHTSNKKNL